MYVPYGRQWIDREDVEQVLQVLEGDFLTTGPYVADFEGGLSAYTGASYAVAVNSGTAALHAAYFAAGIGAGDEIITTPLTFAATANAALYLGASVKFVDVCADTGNLDPQLLEAAITSKTKAIVPVDYAGHPANYDAINAIASAHGLCVIADAAHSLGATYRGRKVGTLATLTATSFHPVKPMTTGEGGAVFTDQADLATALNQFRTHGITRNPEEMVAPEGPWSYEMHQLGYNYRITDIQCALGSSQLRKLDAFLERRRMIAARYLEAFADLDALVLPTLEEGVESGWHLFVVRTTGGSDERRRLFERLREAGVGVQVHYVPVYLHPYYQNLGYRRGICPQAEAFYAGALSLPIFPRMTEEEIAFVIDRTRRITKECLV